MTPAYEIKGIKGHEGERCSQGNLYRSSKKVCEWSDDSWGGAARVKAEKVGRVEIINMRFGAPLKDDSPEHLAAEATFYRKECTKKTLFVRIVDGVRQVLVLSRPYTGALGAQLRAKYPDITRVLNEAV